MGSLKLIIATVAIILGLVQVSSPKVCPVKTTTTTEPPYTRPPMICDIACVSPCPDISEGNCNGTIVPPGSPCNCCGQCHPLPPSTTTTTPKYNPPPFHCDYVCTEETKMNCPKVSPETCEGTYIRAGGTSCGCCDSCITDED